MYSDECVGKCSHLRNGVSNDRVLDRVLNDISIRFDSQLFHDLVLVEENSSPRFMKNVSDLLLHRAAFPPAFAEPSRCCLSLNCFGRPTDFGLRIKLSSIASVIWGVTYEVPRIAARTARRSSSPLHGKFFSRVARGAES